MLEMTKSQLKSSVVNTSNLTNEDNSDRIAELEAMIRRLKALVKKLTSQLEKLKEDYEEAMNQAKFWERKRDEIADKFHDLEDRYDEKVKDNVKKTMTISLLGMKVFLLMNGIQRHI